MVAGVKVVPIGSYFLIAFFRMLTHGGSVA
jgi:hypothetical protein